MAIRVRNLLNASVRSEMTSALKFPSKTFFGNMKSPRIEGWKARKMHS